MIKGLYTAFTGMIAHMTRQQVIANNVANLTTTGFKQDVIGSTESFPSQLLVQPGPGGPIEGPEAILGEITTGTLPTQMIVDFSAGTLQTTENPLDLALVGPGFFTVQTADGLRYTRDGHFHLDADRLLRDAAGNLVLGAGGPIQLPPGEARIDNAGVITVNDQVAGRLQINTFPDLNAVTKSGGNLFTGEGAAPAAGTTSVVQGALEQSNVDAAAATVDMMSALRSYQASQTLARLQDQTIDQAVNDIGKV